MQDNKLNYSVIIPHKNIPNLLQRCLDSIPRREDLEIIVVDDNSDSTIVDFDDFPGLSDPTVKVIFTKKGGGAGYARNIGLREAKGKWLLFADSDDFFSGNSDEIFCDYEKVNIIDIVFFKSESVKSNDLSAVKSRGEKYNNWVEESMHKGEIVDGIRYGIKPPWGKMVKRDFVEKYDIVFDEVLSSNDVMFSIKCGSYAKKIELDDRILYISTVREKSLERVKNKEYIRDRLAV